MKQRILTAIIGLIIFIPIIWYGNWPFVIIAYLLATVALFELIRMYFPNGIVLNMVISSIFLWLIMFPKDTVSFSSITMTKLEIIILFALVLLIFTVITKNKFTFDHGAFLLFATLYVGIAFYLLIELRFEGLNYLLFVLFIIWATDSGAYFTGKLFGKRKLWPEISPNKTIGGAIGGVICALLVGMVFQISYPFEHTFLVIIIFSIVISIVGQIGDLVASAIKRHYEIKDFGRIFPGHGGILDRLDSLLFVLLVLYIVPFV